MIRKPIHHLFPDIDADVRCERRIVHDYRFCEPLAAAEIEDVETRQVRAAQALGQIIEQRSSRIGRASQSLNVRGITVKLMRNCKGFHGLALHSRAGAGPGPRNIAATHFSHNRSKRSGLPVARRSGRLQPGLA